MTNDIDRVATAIFDASRKRVGDYEYLATAAIAAHKAALADAGYVIVPRVATKAMIISGETAYLREAGKDVTHRDLMGGCGIARNESEAFWQAVIDAALGEGDD